MSEPVGSLWRPLASPFPGLRSFEEHEAPIFRGRDRQIDGIAELLAACRLVVVTGASGCGKSSLVRAGVLPALNGGGIAAAGDVWIEVYFRPGKDPLGNLASALVGKLLPPRPEDATSGWSSSEVEEQTLDEVRALLDQANGLVTFRDRFASRLQLDPQLDQALREARDPIAQLTEAGRLAERQADRLQPNANLVVIADQFEEIFNEFNQRSVAAEMLVARLLDVFQSPAPSASSMPMSRVYVVVTMRSEYLGLCATYRQMPYVLNHAAFYVSRLDRAELKAAATEPLRKWHRYAEQAPAIKLEFDTHLLDQLLDATVLIKDDPDHLPLFQHALARLWWIAQDEQSIAGPREGTIGVAHLLRAVSLQHEHELDKLEATRLLARVLEEHAEELYQALDPEQRRIVEVMLRRLATKEPTGNVVRRLAPVRDVAACAHCPEAGVDALLDRFGEPRHELVQTREARGGGEERLVDLAHEALIRKWPSFRRWVDDESELSRGFSGLMRRAQRWAESGAGERNILRDDDLLWARTWLRSMRLYRRSPSAMTAWARRYVTTPAGEWAHRFGGPVAAVAELYRKSLAARRSSRHEKNRQLQASARMEAEIKQARAEADKAEAERQRAIAEGATAAAERDAQRWRSWLTSSAAAMATLLLFIGYWYFWLSTEEQERRTEIADLYATALDNSNLEFGRLPPERRTAVLQELAVSLSRIEHLRKEGASPKVEERLRTLERSVDSAARQTLEAMLVPAGPSAPSTAQHHRWDELVRSCVLTIDAGKSREIKQVALLASPTSSGSGARQAFVVLSRLNNVATLEVVYHRPLRRGRCALGMDGVALSVPAVEDVAMDPSGKWLIQQPRASAGTLALGPRIYRLNWFEVCERAGKDDACGSAERRWRVDAVPLGQYPELELGLLPELPAGIPAPKPIARANELDGFIQSPSPEFEIREQKTEPNPFGEEGGSELYWQGARLSSKAQAGYRIPAYARRDALVGFVVSVRAASARRPRAALGNAVCGGGELCQHILRVVRIKQPEERSGWVRQALSFSRNQLDDPTVATIPVAEIQFIGPPVSGIGFGTGNLENELVIRFAETGEFATVSLGGAPFRQWFCRSWDPASKPEPLFFSQAFRNYVKAEHGNYDGIGSVVETACR